MRNSNRKIKERPFFKSLDQLKIGSVKMRKDQFEVIMRTFILLLVVLQSSLFSLFAQQTADEKEQLKQINQELGAKYKQRKFEEALIYAQRAIDLSTKIYGPESRETASAHKNLGMIFQARKNYKEAIKSFENSLRIYRLNTQQNLKFIAHLLDELSLTFALDGDNLKALETYRQALQSAEAAFGSESKEILPFLKSMAEVLILGKKYVEAHQMYIRQYITARKYYKSESKEIEEIVDGYICFNSQYFSYSELQKNYLEFTDVVQKAENVDSSFISNIGFVGGKAKSLAQPQYPESARLTNEQGVIPVRIVISEEGKVVAAKAICGSAILRQASEDAARKSTFKPTLIDGKAVKATGILVYTFVVR